MSTNARDHEIRKEIIREQQAEIKELTYALAASRKKCERLRDVLLLCSWEIGRDKARGWIGGRDAEERKIIENLLASIKAAAGGEAQ